MRLEDIDPNFKVDTNIEREGMKFYNVEAVPFRIHGVFRDGDNFVRLPQAVADSVSPGVSGLAPRLAGGRVRFVTNSPYVAIHAELCSKYRADHFTMCASIGLDAYIEGNGRDTYYLGTFRPPVNVGDSYQSLKDLPHGMEWEVTINMPLYGGLRALYIGLDENATLKPPRKYTYEKPVLFYGSSITQGGCASRAGMSYQGILSRRLDFDFINLGFSGSAKGEPEMIEYLASLDPSEAAASAVIDTVKALWGKYPLFGIGLGCQILCLAKGAAIDTLPHGHRGGYPVRCCENGKITSTAQNHAYVVNRDSLAGTGLTVLYENVTDLSVEGVIDAENNVIGAQFAPESAPGPQDNYALFDRFIAMMKEDN